MPVLGIQRAGALRGQGLRRMASQTVMNAATTADIPAHSSCTPSALSVIEQSSMTTKALPKTASVRIFISGGGASIVHHLIPSRFFASATQPISIAISDSRARIARAMAAATAARAQVMSVSFAMDALSQRDVPSATESIQTMGDTEAVNHMGVARDL
jgi:hypothetical protein